MLLALPLTAVLFLPSCVSEYGYDQGPRVNAPSRSGYTTYASLPSGYSGSAYYYNNRYYTGGRYEPGTFSYRGRTYSDRYYHNGQYFYGGNYRQQASAGFYQNPGVRSTASVGYVTYRDLPSNYAGSAYYYNNQYYAGGRYEPGTYSHNGRTYSQRYYHNGQYLYGGDYRQPATVISDPRTLHRSGPGYRTNRR